MKITVASLCKKIERLEAQKANIQAKTDAYQKDKEFLMKEQALERINEKQK